MMVVVLASGLESAPVGDAAVSKGVTTVPYSLAELFPRAADAELFHAITEPDAFLHEEPSYVTWSPKIHRAPTASA